MSTDVQPPDGPAARGATSSPSSYLRRFLILSSLCALVFFAFQIAWQVRTRKVHTFVYRIGPGTQSGKEIAATLSRRIRNLRRFERISRAEAVWLDREVRVTVTSSYPIGEYMKWLLRPGVVTLRLVHPNPKALPLKPGETVPAGYVIETLKETTYLLGEPGETKEVGEPYLVRREPELVLTRFRAVTFHTTGLSRRAVITLQFEPEDAKRFTRITSSNTGRRLAFFLDDELCSVPMIVAPIEGDRVEMQGFFYLPAAKRWVSILSAGAILDRLEPVSQPVQ